MKVLARMPAVDQPVEEITLSHLSAASLPRPYGGLLDRGPDAESLLPLARYFPNRGGYPS